jgi:putative PIN family toxin of toxin-antitoxin system
MQNEVFILDSNIWISYVITKRLHGLVSIILDQHLTVLTSQHLVKEISEVLARTKFKKYLKRTDIEEVIALHLKLCQFVSAEETVPLLADPKDDFLISLYKTGNATILVTGDKELLQEATRLNCRVMTLKDFELIGQQR